MRTIVSFLLAALGFAAPLFAQQTKILTGEKHNEYGVVYYLPVTALNIEVTAEITTLHRGPYYQYARKFIGTDKVITADAASARITDLKVTPFGVPDTETLYLMQLKPGATTFLAVAENGSLLAINRNPAAQSSLTSFQKTKNAEIESKLSQRNDGVNDYLRFVNEDFIASQSSFKQAEMLAESLMEVRESKLALTRGTAETMPVDGKQLEIMLAALEEQERAITQAFTGVRTTSQIKRTFTFTPEDVERKTLFRFSDFAGFVAPDDLSGDPVTIEIADAIAPETPVDAKGEEKKLPKDAVIYNIPGSALIRISACGETLYENRHELAQLGITFGLAPTLFTDKKQPSWAIFDPVTGALREIGSLSSAEQ